MNLINSGLRAYPPAMPPAAVAPPRAWSRYRDSLARHLIGISRDLQARARETLREELGHSELRPSFGPFLGLLWEEGRPLTAIASELAISKQACSQLAKLMERAGYLERRPNPADQRSKLVMLTPLGRSVVEEGVRIILETGSEYAALVGEVAYRQFRTALAVLYSELGLPPHADPVMVSRAGRSVGMLPLIAVRVQRELMEATAARGYDGLKMSHAQVLPLIGPEGGRIHEIARVQRVSRQAISAVARELEGLGYLRRRSDPRDRRGVVLELTDRGEALIRDSVAEMGVLEDRFREILGARRMDHLQSVARALYHALHLEAEVFPPSLPGAAPGNGAGSREPRGDRDIRRLATRLRRQLGRGDAARLAALLQPREDAAPSPPAGGREA